MLQVHLSSVWCLLYFEELQYLLAEWPVNYQPYLCFSDDNIKVDKEDNSIQGEHKKKRVFEALIEDKGKNVIYLKLSSDTVREYNITGGAVFYAEVQFQLNRLQYCEWHHAVDSIQDYKILFPETFLEPDIPWTPQRYVSSAPCDQFMLHCHPLSNI